MTVFLTNGRSFTISGNVVELIIEFINRQEGNRDYFALYPPEGLTIIKREDVSSVTPANIPNSENPVNRLNVPQHNSDIEFFRHRCDGSIEVVKMKQYYD